MHDKKVFTGCMIRHGGLLAAEAILALAVSVILVQGNKIISGVIDEMLSGRQVLFGSFLLQFLIYTVVVAPDADGAGPFSDAARNPHTSPHEQNRNTISYSNRKNEDLYEIFPAVQTMGEVV